MGKSWKSLGYAKPRLGRLGRLGMLGKKTWQSAIIHRPPSLSLSPVSFVICHFSFLFSAAITALGVGHAEMQKARRLRFTD